MKGVLLGKGTPFTQTDISVTRLENSVDDA
jgi:hypothetical protein